MKSYTTFKFPYLLIEDLKGKFQPIYKEYSKAEPEIDLYSPPQCCPFSNARRSNNQNKKITPKAGYCEICYVRYDDYNLHVLRKEHREFAEDDFNYRSIDILIKDMLEKELSGMFNYVNSPCDRLEQKFSQLNQAYFNNSSDVENLIRISKGSFDDESSTVDFGIILKNIDKNEYK